MSTQPKYAVGDEVLFAFGGRIAKGSIKKVTTYESSSLEPDYLIEHLLETSIEENAMLPVTAKAAIA